MSFYQDGSVSKTRVSFLEADDIKVNKGTVGSPNWKDVLVGNIGTPTDPFNLRVYDIDPTSNPNERASMVEIRWNYDDLSGSTVTGATSFTFSETTFNNETVDLGANDPVGKYLYFPSSGNSYEITSYTYSSSEYTVQIDGNLATADTVSIDNPARIIDKDISGYNLVIKNPNNGQAIIQQLNESFITKPSYRVKLELGSTWNITLQATDLGYQGSVITMPSGSYDPDHSVGGQSSIDYDSNFENKLPNISPSGTLSLKADAQGFQLSIGGWNNSQDPTDSAHEYEIIYTSERDDLSVSDFDNLGEDGIEHKIIQSKKTHISSGRPTRFAVIARPLQNKQQVAPAESGTITAGGGGVAPQSTVIADRSVEVDIITADIQEEVQTGEYKVIWKNRYGNQIRPPAYSQRGRRLERPDGSLIHINEHFDYVNDLDGVYRIRVPQTTLLTTEEIVSGKSKEDRKIGEQSLDIDMEITKLEFICTSATDTTQQNPGIIRVYQKGREDYSVNLEVPGQSEDPWVNKVNLPIKIDGNSERIIYIDAWDPDKTTDPQGNPNANNSCEIFGQLKVTAKPIVVNNID